MSRPQDRRSEALRAILLGRHGFGARYVKTAIAMALAVLLADATFGPNEGAAFAGMSAFAAVGPTTRQSRDATFGTLAANLLGGGWAVATFLLLPVPQAVQLVVAVAGGLFLAHRFLPAYERAGVVAILSLVHQVAPEQPIALLHRLGIVLLGALTGIVVNAFYPPRHAAAAREALHATLPSLRRFARRVIAALPDPERLAKETVRASLDAIQERLDQAAQRLSYLDEHDRDRLLTRRRIATAVLALESFAEMHRFALHRGGLDEAERERVKEVAEALLAALDEVLDAAPPAGASVWETLYGVASDPVAEPHLYPFHHLIFRLRRLKGTDPAAPA